MQTPPPTLEQLKECLDRGPHKSAHEYVELLHEEMLDFVRIMRNIVRANPWFGLVLLCKVDLSNGFYQIKLNLDSILKLAVAIPPLVGEEKLIAIPLRAPMGYIESPPYFTAITKTITDVANDRAAAGWEPPPH